MLPTEARWFADRLADFSKDEVFPLCNLGSAGVRFRTREQPWIDRYLFSPLREAQQPVLHVDLKPDDGVDLCGDVYDESFIRELSGQEFRAVLCANVLEHVEDPHSFARQVARLVPPGGLLFVSCPRAFPYHPDPIDTMFRPRPNELAELFPQTELQAAEVVRDGTLAHYALGRACGNPGELARTLWRRGIGGDRRGTNGQAAAPATWKTYWPWLFRRFEITCVVLRKTDENANGCH